MFSISCKAMISADVSLMISAINVYCSFVLGIISFPSPSPSQAILKVAMESGRRSSGGFVQPNNGWRSMMIVMMNGMNSFRISSFLKHCFEYITRHLWVFFESSCRIAIPIFPKWYINSHVMSKA